MTNAGKMLKCHAKMNAGNLTIAGIVTITSTGRTGKILVSIATNPKIWNVGTTAGSTHVRNLVPAGGATVTPAGKPRWP